MIDTRKDLLTKAGQSLNLAMLAPIHAIKTQLIEDAARDVAALKVLLEPLPVRPKPFKKRNYQPQKHGVKIDDIQTIEPETVTAFYAEQEHLAATMEKPFSDFKSIANYFAEHLATDCEAISCHAFDQIKLIVGDPASYRAG